MNGLLKRVVYRLRARSLISVEGGLPHAECQCGYRGPSRVDEWPEGSRRLTAKRQARRDGLLHLKLSHPRHSNAESPPSRWIRSLDDLDHEQLDKIELTDTPRGDGSIGSVLHDCRLARSRERLLVVSQ